MLTASFSTIGLPLPSQDGLNIFRISANLVNPQSASSALNLWLAAITSISPLLIPHLSSILLCDLNIDGSFLFHMTRVNCTQAYQPSGTFSSSSLPCSRYMETWSTLFPLGNSNTRLHFLSVYSGELLSDSPAPCNRTKGIHHTRIWVLAP